MNFKRNWLNIVKYVVLIGLVLWIWRTIRKDSTEYFGNGETEENFRTPLPSTNFLNGFSEKFETDTNGVHIESVESKDFGDSKGQCTSCSADGVSEDGVKLLPVMDPLFNMREICKQCILLEDHLNNPEKRCTDCITKHGLTIEALAEEAVGLDKDGKFKFLNDLAKKCRNLQKECNKKGLNKCEIAQKYRHIRKALMPICRDKC